MEVEEPRIVFSFERKPNAEYCLNAVGEVVEIVCKATVIGCIRKREGYVYEIVRNAVIERKVIKMGLDEYYKRKETGEIAALLHQGVEIEIDTKDVPLEVLNKIDDEQTKNQLIGRKIKDVKITREKGKRMIVLYFDNDKRLILREGLLAGGAAIELE